MNTIKEFRKGIEEYEKLTGEKIEAGLYSWLESFIKDKLTSRKELVEEIEKMKREKDLYYEDGILPDNVDIFNFAINKVIDKLKKKEGD